MSEPVEVVRIRAKYHTLPKKRKKDVLLLILEWANKELEKLKGDK